MIVILALLLIVFVMWFFKKRINKIEEQMRQPVAAIKK